MYLNVVLGLIAEDKVDLCCISFCGNVMQFASSLQVVLSIPFFDKGSQDSLLVEYQTYD